APEAAHLALRERVLRMTRQPGVEYALDLRMALEPLRHRERVLAMPLHAHGERLQAPGDEKAVEGAGHGPDRVLHEAEPLRQAGIGRDRDAADHVGMPVQ